MATTVIAARAAIHTPFTRAGAGGATAAVAAAAAARLAAPAAAACAPAVETGLEVRGAARAAAATALPPAAATAAATACTAAAAAVAARATRAGRNLAGCGGVPLPLAQQPTSGRHADEAAINPRGLPHRPPPPGERQAAAASRPVPPPSACGRLHGSLRATGDRGGRAAVAATMGAPAPRQASAAATEVVAGKRRWRPRRLQRLPRHDSAAAAPGASGGRTLRKGR